MKTKMTKTQKRFVELDRRKDEIKKFFEEYNEAVAAVVQEFSNEAEMESAGNFFQDDQGVVYKTDIPEGRFVYFDKYAILRTRRENETKGSLSMKEAAEAGFTIPEQKEK